MRLFIASPVELYRYENIQEAFDSSIKGKWVKRHNTHLTWIFLGDTLSPNRAQACLREASVLLREPVTLRGLGTFGKPPHILYARSDASVLYKQAEALASVGFESARFKPHVTLCRIKTLYDKAAFVAQRKRFETTVIGTVIPRITLYRSTLTPQGPRYTPLFTIQAP